MNRLLFLCLSVLSITAIFLAACQKPQGPATQSADSAKSTTKQAGSETAPSPSPTSTIPAELKPIEFTDVTAQAGIKFRHNNGAFGNKYLPETTGSGCAFLDYDNDGWQDVLLINSMDFSDAPQTAQSAQPAQGTQTAQTAQTTQPAQTAQAGKKRRRSVMALYHNNQNGTFTDVTAAAGLAKPMYGMGAAIGDYDNDGFVDIFVTALGQSRLFRNGGNGKFTDVTAKVGLSSPGYFSSSAAFFDYDKDGRLDLFLCNYVEWSAETDVFCALDNVN